MYWFGWVIVLVGASLIFRLIVRQDYLIKGRLTWISTLLEILIFAGHANLYYLFLPTPWPDLPPLPDQGLSSCFWLGIMILGGMLTLGFMAYLGFSTAFGGKADELRQSGPYKWSRNPQLLAYYLVVIGFAFLYPSLESAAWVLLYGIISHIMIKTEEEHLLNVYGSSYQEYCARVPRYIRLSSISDLFSNS
jgi:protein-S-isoprenylcysteine O-methyltransferase Ste14